MKYLGLWSPGLQKFVKPGPPSYILNVRSLNVNKPGNIFEFVSISFTKKAYKQNLSFCTSKANSLSEKKNE